MTLPSVVTSLRTWRPGVGAIAIVAVWLVWTALALGQLNALLGSMHAAGSPSFTVSDVNRFSGGPDTDSSSGVLEVWKAFAAASETTEGDAPTASPLDVVHLFAWLDSLLLAPLYALLGVLFFRRIEKGPRTDLHDVARWGRYLILGAAAFDVLENVALSKVVTLAWTLDLATDAHELDGRLRVLWVGAAGKWLLAGFALFLALIAIVVLVADALKPTGAASPMDSRREWRRAHLIGFQVAVVVFAVILFNQQGQLADLYRRWQWAQLGLSVTMLAFAAYAVWAVTRRLLLFGPHEPLKEPEEKVWKHRLAYGLLGLAALQFALHKLLDDWRFDPGWGLLVPAGMIVFLAAAGRLLDPVGARTAPPPFVDDPKTAPEPLLPRVLATALVLGFAFALERASFGYVVYGKQWDWGNALLLVAAAAAGALLVPRLAGAVPAGLARRAVKEPVTGAAVATVLAGIYTCLRRHPEDIDPTVLVTLSALLVIGGLRWFVALGKEGKEADARDKRLSWPALLIVGGVCVALVVAIVARPLGMGQAFSATGVIAAFLAMLFLASGLAAWIGPAVPQARVFAALRLPHFPLTAFLLVWFLAASYADRDGAYHDARVREVEGQPAVRLSVEQGWECWLARHGLAPSGASEPADVAGCAVASPTSASTGVVPLVVVASTGGGIRSAYWTALALDCAFEVDYDISSEALRLGGTRKRDPCRNGRPRADFVRSDALLATSGISGGSLGQAEYAAHLVSKEAGRAKRTWVADALEVDGLSPAGARWLFVELPRVFLQFSGPHDRAAILERAWEERWPDKELETGLNELAREHPHAPFLLLNSTSVQDGCRFNVSVLDAGISLGDGERQACRSNAPFDEPVDATSPIVPNERVDKRSTLPAARDLVDLLCEQPVDLNLSTAALLSARFPFVNPTGRVASRCPGESPKAVVHGVDGGYLDTSGASPLVELMTVLRPTLEAWNVEHAAAGTCVVPFMIQIDNGFEDTSPPRDGRRPPELSAPLQTLFATRIGRAAEARTGAALLFNQEFPGATHNGGPVGDRYAHFVNEAHPGPAAPFGWAQSRFSQTELADQLLQKKNLAALAEVDAWFDAVADGTLACAAPEPT